MYRVGALIASIFILNSYAYADAKTAEALCSERNAAHCEIGGVKFFITEEGCPKGAKVLRPHGTERCDQLLTAHNSAVKTEEAVVQSAAEALAASPAPSPQHHASLASWENPYFILTLLGLLQGIISRVGIGPIIIVAVVMPVIATWGIFSGANFQSGFTENFGYVGMELLGTFLFCMAGWIVGVGIHLGTRKLVLKHW